LPVRVEANFRRLLDIMNERKVHATCFFIGHIARRFPHLVREAAARGHEIASHSFAHKLIYTMTPVEFLEDATTSRKLLDDIAGAPVTGFRASGFSVTCPVSSTPDTARSTSSRSAAYSRSSAAIGTSGLVRASRMIWIRSTRRRVARVATVDAFHHWARIFSGRGYSADCQAVLTSGR
jgi:peptidoglycan/xylan/chitin deacetylase (PgdA/CDA1 family)